MAGFAIELSAASAKASLAASPLASSMASVGATATGGELVVAWLKITAVPLLVFLIGACIWGCIKSSTAWRTLAEGGGGNSSRNEAGEVVPADSSRPVDNMNRDAIDLEAGLELSQVGAKDDDRYVSVDSKCTATHAHMDGRLAPPFKTTSDIGGAPGC